MTQGKRTTLTDTQALSRAARDALEAALVHLGEGARAAYWASVRKCYNAPYEEDGHGRRAREVPLPEPGAVSLARAAGPEGRPAPEQPSL